MLLTLKSFEIFPKYNGYGFTSEFFDLIWCMFGGINKKTVLFITKQTSAKKKKKKIDIEKLMGFLVGIFSFCCYLGIM